MTRPRTDARGALGVDPTGERMSEGATADHRARYIASGLIRPGPDVATVERAGGIYPARPAYHRAPEAEAAMYRHPGGTFDGRTPLDGVNRRFVEAHEITGRTIRRSGPLDPTPSIARARAHGHVPQSPALTSIPPHSIRKTK